MEYETSVLEAEHQKLDLESLSDDELENMLFEEEPSTEKGFLNLPTIAGLSLIVVGVAYIFQELGLWSGFDISVLAEMLPWLAGILIILLGFGVLSWRPKKKRKVRATIELPTGKEKVVEVKTKKKDLGKKRLIRSKNKKIAGVAGGIAEYFSIDPTLVRIAFVIGMIASTGWPMILAYIVMAVVMPEPESDPSEGRITIIKD
ncbi:MAG: PspC domain-containing protein [Rhodothermales bacterium]